MLTEGTDTKRSKDPEGGREGEGKSCGEAAVKCVLALLTHRVGRRGTKIIRTPQRQGGEEQFPQQPQAHSLAGKPSGSLMLLRILRQEFIGREEEVSA